MRKVSAKPLEQEESSSISPRKPRGGTGRTWTPCGPTSRSRPTARASGPWPDHPLEFSDRHICSESDAGAGRWQHRSARVCRTHPRLSWQLWRTSFWECGAPSDLFNMIFGRGDLGSKLVDDARVAGVSFTGSQPVGAQVAIAAVKRHGVLEVQENHVSFALKRSRTRHKSWGSEGRMETDRQLWRGIQDREGLVAVLGQHSAAWTDRSYLIGIFTMITRCWIGTGPRSSLPALPEEARNQLETQY